MRIVWAILFIWSFLIVWFFLSLPGHATGFENSPNHQWFANQKNQNNTSCCEIADGHHLDDADWKSDDKGNYWVRIESKWREVPNYAVINPKNRPVDYAVVWIYNDTIYCFMAGAGM